MKGKTWAIPGILAVVAVMVVMTAVAPMASAQEDDNDHQKKCKGHKYGKICDNDKPSLKVTTPHKGAKFHKGDTLTVSGVATDKTDGISKVTVSFDAPGVVVSSSNGPFTFSAPITVTGHFLLTIKAHDHAGNVAIVHIPIRVLP